MRTRIVSGITLTLLLLSMLTLAFNIQLVKSEPRTWTVDDDGAADFSSIQEAIDAASNGDTIYVYNGTYYEHPIIGKDDLMIVGENKNDTIIDGDGIGAVVRVTAANVTISGFTVQNSGWRWYYDEGSGFYLGAGPKVTIFVNISDNIISNCYFGISLSNSLRNTINGNTISNAGVGVSFFDSAYNNLSGNTISDIEYDGIVFWNPYDNDVTGNLITNCSGVGVRIRAGYENTIIGNTITEADYGVLFYLSDHNVIQENNITGSEWNGIDLLNSSENTVTENNVANNRNGIVTQWAQNNSIYNNNFVENTFQVITYDSVNIWDDGYPSGGNYWSDYGGIDFYSGPYQNETTSDGIGDTPYIIDGDNQDNYPLMNPWTPAPPTVISVEPPTSTAAPTETFAVDINVVNIMAEESLYGWEFRIGFNTTILDAVSVVQGPFLTDTGYSTFFTKKINNTAGTVQALGIITEFPYPPQGAVGNGTLCTITFLVEAGGADPLHFENTDLRTVSGEYPKQYDLPIDHTAEDGYFNNTSPPPPAITVTVNITPNSLNLRSKGKWITAHIKLPEGYNVEDIDVSTIMLNDVLPAESSQAYRRTLMVKFDRSEEIALLPQTGEVELALTGKLFDGTSFEGSDSIRVILPPTGCGGGCRRRKT